MAEGFYERLGVGDTASLEEIKSAYQRKLAELVRRLRTARRRGADVSILESRERALREAMDVLQDANRRRRYDAFIQTGRMGLPEDADELWDRARNSMVDPVAAAALASVQELTELPTGDPLPELTAEVSQAEPPPQPVPRAATPDHDSHVIRFSEERPTVADEPNPVPTEVEWEEETPSISKLDMALPEAQADLYDSSSTPQTARIDVNTTPEPEAVAPAAVAVALDGRYLARVRAEKSITLDELSATTRISARYLEAIEENAFDKLPAAPFVRGYVRQVAQILGVEDQGVVEGFMDMYNHHRG